MQRYKAVVVGLGAQGSAALYHLSKALGGAGVLGLEAQPEVGHSFGSSHGLSRIIRLAYQEHPAYVPLLRSAYRLWRELEQETGADLLTITGCLDISGPSSAASPHGHSCFEGSLAAARQHSLPHEVLSAAQVSQRFPGYRLPNGFQAVFQPDGGFLAPERGIQAHVAAAQQHGASVACGTRVLGWEPAPQYGGAQQGVVVHTEGPCGKRASLWAERLVLAAGPWLPKLVPEITELLQVERQVVGWFELKGGRSSDFGPDKFPVFLLQDETGYYYGFPADEHGFKIGKYHHLNEAADPDSLSREITAADEQVLRQCVERYFPGAAGRLTRASACMFTNTPDEHFVIDLHPRYPQAVVCSACSGHGYKFATVCGQALAELAVGGSTQHDIGFLRIHADRPGHVALLERFNLGTA